MTGYLSQTWSDSNVLYPVSAARMTVVETALSEAKRRTLNVKDYGAVGDGVANDAAAVQAAIDNAASIGGAIIFFPIGTYKCNTGLSVTTNGIHLRGVSWDQSLFTGGSIIQAGAAMTNLLNVASTSEKFTMVDLELDGNALATNCVKVASPNCQFTRCLTRYPATNGVGFYVTGTHAWLTDCRFNGVFQPGSVGYYIDGTVSNLSSCKGAACMDAVQYTVNGLDGMMHGCQWVPGTTIGRCAINVVGNANNLMLIGNRIGDHTLGSGIQVSPSANIFGLQIVGNTFYQIPITNNTFAAIGLDTSSAHIYQCVINGNIVRSTTGHLYEALLSAQKLNGSNATNPGRIANDGTVVSGNSVYAAAMYGTSSTPMAARGNVFSSDGVTWGYSTDVGS